MSDPSKSEWSRQHEESVRHEDERFEPEPWWSANRVRGWLLLAAVPAVAVDLTFGAVGFDANWPAFVTYVAVLAAGVAVSARRHLLRQTRDREASLRRYLDAAPPTSESGNN